MKPPTSVLWVLALALAISLWFLRPSGNAPASLPDNTTATASQDANSSRASGTPKASRFPLLRRTAPAPTAQALRTSAESLKSDSAHTRSTLTNLFVLTILSDTLLAHPDASDADLIRTLADEGIPEAQTRELLAHYPDGNLTLPNLYDRARQVPELRSIEEAADRCGLAFDPSSDGLLDCYRFVAGSGELVDFLNEVQRTLEAAPEAAGFAAETARLANEQQEARGAFHTAYRERFLLRHGLTEAQSEALLNELATLRAPSATTELLYVPRRIPSP
jgi:hypothetical protein